MYLNAEIPLRACRLLLATAVLLITGQSAFADTTTLICDTGYWGNAGPATMVLDAVNNSVTLNTAAMKNPGGRPDPIPGSKQGPFTANFGKEEITFTQTFVGEQSPVGYKINRLTGIATLKSADGSSQWNCHVGTAQF